MDGTVSFDGNNLQTFDYTARTGIIVDDIDLDNLPTKVLSLMGLAHANDSAISWDGYPSKTLPITGTVVGSSANDLSTRLDLFRSYLTGRKKYLDIGYNGSVRRYIATLTPNSKIKRNPNKKNATFSLEFICTPGFGQEVAATTALNGTARTAALYSDAYTWLGTAPSQLPIATITLTAVTPGSGQQQMYWGNNDTGQGITITRSTWAAADVIVIDCVQKQVTVNGIPTDYSGAFPEFTPGAHSMSYSDTFTSRTMTENVVYNKRYM